MKHPCEAQVAWEICKLVSELDAFLSDLYWDAFEAIYEKEEAEKHWSILLDDHLLERPEILLDLSPLEKWPTSSSLLSSSFLNTSARKLQNTCPG